MDVPKHTKVRPVFFFVGRLPIFCDLKKIIFLLIIIFVNFELSLDNFGFNYEQTLEQFFINESVFLVKKQLIVIFLNV